MNKNLKMVGNFVAFENDATNSWIRLEETIKEFKESVSGVRLQVVKRSALVTIPTDECDDFAKMWTANGIEGKIYITEMIESDLPRNFTEDFEGNKKDVSAYAKVAGDTLLPCAKDGEQIYRFAKYDPTGEKKDTLVAHTNGDAISRVAGAQRKAINANLAFEKDLKDKTIIDEAAQAKLESDALLNSLTPTAAQIAEARKNAGKPAVEPVV